MAHTNLPSLGLKSDAYHMPRLPASGYVCSSGRRTGAGGTFSTTALSQPGGLLGNRDALEALGIRVMTDEEAVVSGGCCHRFCHRRSVDGFTRPRPWLLVVADHAWTLEEVVGLLEATEE